MYLDSKLQAYKGTKKCFFSADICLKLIPRTNFSYYFYFNYFRYYYFNPGSY